MYILTCIVVSFRSGAGGNRLNARGWPAGPASAYADHMGTPEDKQNYTLLLQEIRNALDALGKKKGREYGLTAALPCGPNHMDNIEIGVVSKLLTELNLMTYDMYG